MKTPPTPTEKDVGLMAVIQTVNPPTLNRIGRVCGIAAEQVKQLVRRNPDYLTIDKVGNASHVRLLPDGFARLGVKVPSLSSPLAVPKPKAAKPKASTPKADGEKDHTTQAFYAVYCDYFEHLNQAKPKPPTAADIKAAKEIAAAIQNVPWLWETYRNDGNAQFWAYYHKLREQAVFRWSTELSLPAINKEWNTVLALIKRLHNGEYVGTLTAKEQSRLRNDKQFANSAREKFISALAEEDKRGADFI